MKKIRDSDGRRMTYTELTRLRTRGVKAVQIGESLEMVAIALCIIRITIYDWRSPFQRRGRDALKASKWGCRNLKLDRKMLKWVCDTVTIGNLLQIKFAFTLRTRQMISALIEKKYGIKLSMTSVGQLFDQLGITAQRLLWRAYHQNLEAADKWLEKEFPTIKYEAIRCRGEIYFRDEVGNTWAREGRTPVVRTIGCRFGFNMIAAVSSKGMLRFMVVEGTVIIDQFIEFIKRLFHGNKRNILMLVDGTPASKAKKNRSFVDPLNGQLSLHLSPGYSPYSIRVYGCGENLKSGLLGKSIT